jgi:AbrB family looped-hinge helix DNA binding protein
MSTVVTRKGQITLPKAVRAWLGTAPGGRVGIELAADGTVMLVNSDGWPPPAGFARIAASPALD